MPPMYVLNFTSNPAFSLVVIFSYAPPLISPPPPLQVIIAQSLMIEDLPITPYSFTRVTRRRLRTSHIEDNVAYEQALQFGRAK